MIIMLLKFFFHFATKAIKNAVHFVSLLTKDGVVDMKG